jgi:hypothetical protein
MPNNLRLGTVLGFSMITFLAIAISANTHFFVPAISNSMRNPDHSKLRRAAPSLRLDFPDAIAVRERVRVPVRPTDCPLVVTVRV